MKLISTTTSVVTTTTYTIATDVLGTVYFTEYLNDKGKVIDVTIRDENGHNVEDASLLEQMEALVDESAPH